MNKYCMYLLLCTMLIPKVDMSIILRFVVLVLLNFIILVFSQKDMGPGLWMIKNVKDCEDPGQFKIQSVLERKKINRTHDSFNLAVTFLEDLDCSYSLLIDVYKLCDGGYKYQQKIEDKCACTFADENINSNFVQATFLASLAPECPIPMGIYNIEDFIMNYEELPKQCIYGEFLAEVYIKNMGETVFCSILELECEETQQTP